MGKRGGLGEYKGNSNRIWREAKCRSKKVRKVKISKEKRL